MDSPTEIRRQLGCAYETAYRVLADHRLAMAALAGPPTVRGSPLVRRHALASH